MVRVPPLENPLDWGPHSWAQIYVVVGFDGSPVILSLWSYVRVGIYTTMLPPPSAAAAAGGNVLENEPPLSFVSKYLYCCSKSTGNSHRHRVSFLMAMESVVLLLRAYARTTTNLRVWTIILLVIHIARCPMMRRRRSVLFVVMDFQSVVAYDDKNGETRHPSINQNTREFF